MYGVLCNHTSWSTSKQKHCKTAKYRYFIIIKTVFTDILNWNSIVTCQFFFKLEAFLTQRLQELKVDDLLVSSQFQAAPVVLHVNKDDLQSMLGEVKGILGQLTTKRMQELILIRSSPR